MTVSVLRIGTRGSKLALWQTHWVIDRLKQLHPQLNVEVVEIHTAGDHLATVPLHQIGEGAFVKELERALLAGEVDLAVHSLKDMPSQVTAGLRIAAVPGREDPRDALVSRLGVPLARLPVGARVGTSSLRRTAQLRALRPDLQILAMRGNVDTRLRKAEGEGYDGTVLAAAGLIRLGLAGRITEYLAPEVILPSPGQGALAVECRAEDERVQALVSPLDDLPSRLATTAERSLLSYLGVGCHVPVAAYATVQDGQVWLRGLVANEDGSTIVRGEEQGEEAEQVGYALAQQLLALGAEELLAPRAEVLLPVGGRK